MIVEFKQGKPKSGKLGRWRFVARGADWLATSHPKGHPTEEGARFEWEAMLRDVRRREGYFGRLRIPTWFAVYWATTMLVLIFTETRWGFGWWPWPLVTAALLFIVGESVGVARSAKGDTFSEFVRKLYGGGVFRVPLIVGMTVYIGLAIWSGFQGADVWTDWQAWRVGLLAGGIVLWLVPHFLSSGKHG